MSAELALRNLAAWSLQVAVLALAAAALARVLPIARPAARLAFGQLLLIVALGLPLLQPWQAATATVDASLTGAPFTAALEATLAQDLPKTHLPWPTLITGVLLLGCCLRLLQFGAGLRRLRALRRQARPFAVPPWLRDRRDELAPAAAFLRSDDAQTPATFGWRRPIVLLPPGFASLEPAQQEAVAVHELLHARRGDWLVLTAEELLRALLFFHPAVHWLVGRVRLAREQTVDAEVVRRLGGRDAYLESLIAVARFSNGVRAVPAAPFLRESHLRERVDLLLREVAMSRVRAAAHVALTVSALVLAVAVVATAVPLQAAKPATVAVEDKAAAPGEPKLVKKVEPAYPASAKDEKVQGIFVIGIEIGKDGKIHAAKVVASAPTADRLPDFKKGKVESGPLEGDKRLAEAALAAVKQWEYEPILKDGKPVDFKALVTINFKLH